MHHRLLQKNLWYSNNFWAYSKVLPCSRAACFFLSVSAIFPLSKTNPIRAKQNTTSIKFNDVSDFITLALVGEGIFRLTQSSFNCCLLQNRFNSFCKQGKNKLKGIKTEGRHLQKTPLNGNMNRLEIEV